LYQVDRVLNVQNSPEFKTWLREKEARKDKTKTAQAKRFERFSKKYRSWTVALPDGCEYLFNLNRYVKHGSCSGPHREAIYDLKNEMVKLLYTHGYSTDCFEHHHNLPEQECFGCDGTGAFDLYDLDPCRRCNGTGIYRKGSTLTFVCFRFDVGGRSYCWHQPDELVNFEYRCTKTAAKWESSEDEKPVQLNRAKFAAAKDLLRWIISQANPTDSLGKENTREMAA
jgi:hypothetical protein